MIMMTIMLNLIHLISCKAMCSSLEDVFWEGRPLIEHQDSPLDVLYVLLRSKCCCYCTQFSSLSSFLDPHSSQGRSYRVRQKCAHIYTVVQSEWLFKTPGAPVSASCTEDPAQETRKTSGDFSAPCQTFPCPHTPHMGMHFITSYEIGVAVCTLIPGVQIIWSVVWSVTIKPGHFGIFYNSLKQCRQGD